MSSKSALTVAAVFLVAIVVGVGVYAALTFPRAVVDFQVSFTVGVDNEQREFEMPALHEKAQVEFALGSGSALWRASIINAEGTTIWEHTKAQGDQTIYQSEWLTLPSGRYNFTFGTIGLGELQANVKVTTKGGFW
jgi:hypothetical protein